MSASRSRLFIWGADGHRSCGQQERLTAQRRIAKAFGAVPSLTQRAMLSRADGDTMCTYSV